MFILCPHCQFLVTLDPGGQPPARCPSCDQPLLALPPETSTPVADIPAADATDADVPDAVPDPISAATHDALQTASPAAPDLIDATLPEAAAQPTDTEPTAAYPVSEAAPTIQPSDPETPAPPASTKRSRQARAAPSFARSQRPDGAITGAIQWKSASAIAGLSLLLALQLLLADRARLSADAQWRPALSVLCNMLRCSLPPWREPAAFTLLNREVRPHPAIPGVLRVTATFRNDARWPQPWPALLLTLSDVDGRAVGARVFDARDYLGASPTRTGLESGQSATIAMDVREPSPRIVAFTFDFH